MCEDIVAGVLTQASVIRQIGWKLNSCGGTASCCFMTIRLPRSPDWPHCFCLSARLDSAAECPLFSVLVIESLRLTEGLTRCLHKVTVAGKRGPVAAHSRSKCFSDKTNRADLI